LLRDAYLEVASTSAFDLLAGYDYWTKQQHVPPSLAGTRQSRRSCRGTASSSIGSKPCCRKPSPWRR
jgi:hypothetical protein